MALNLFLKNFLNLKPYHEIVEYYKKDPILYKGIQRVGTVVTPEPNADVYLSLLSSIVAQQLSTKVVRIIWNRFADLFVDRYPHPEKLVVMDHETLRGTGLSNSKVNYVKNVARFRLENEMSYAYLQAKTDQQIIDYLTEIKGVGIWTVQMILMFPMDRPNVFPVNDLGIQNVMKKMYGLDLEKKQLLERLHEIAGQWDPYRSLACKYIWEIGGI